MAAFSGGLLGTAARAAATPALEAPPAEAATGSCSCSMASSGTQMSLQTRSDTAAFRGADWPTGAVRGAVTGIGR